MNGCSDYTEKYKQSVINLNIHRTCMLTTSTEIFHNIRNNIKQMLVNDDYSSNIFVYCNLIIMVILILLNID